MGGKYIHAYPKSIRPKVNVIAQLEFELASFMGAAKHFSYEPTEKEENRPIKKDSIKTKII